MSFTTQTIQNSDGASILSTTLFSFDDEVVNSQAYRRALAKAYAATQDESETTAIASKQSEELLDSTLDDAEPSKKESQDDVGLNSQASKLTMSSNSREKPILTPTPEDTLTSFMFEKQVPEQDWVDF